MQFYSNSLFQIFFYILKKLFSDPYLGTFAIHWQEL